MTDPDPQQLLRAQVVALLQGGQAHMGFAAAVADFPPALINARAPRVPYTFWHLVEHVRLAQADILDYLTNPAYHAPTWPQDYWPPREAQATPDTWAASIAACQRDLDALVALVADPRTDLFAPVPSNSAHTVLREALLVADHNAYHTGELAILRQVAEAWSPAREV